MWMAAPAPRRLEAAGPFARAGVPVSRSASLRAEFGRRAPKASVSSFSFRRSALIRASRAVCVSRVTIRVQTGIDSVSPSVSPIARTVCSKLNRAAEVYRSQTSTYVGRPDGGAISLRGRLLRWTISTTERTLLIVRHALPLDAATPHPSAVRSSRVCLRAEAGWVPRSRPHPGALLPARVAERERLQVLAAARRGSRARSALSVGSARRRRFAASSPTAEHTSINGCFGAAQRLKKHWETQSDLIHGRAVNTKHSLLPRRVVGSTHPKPKCDIALYFM